MNLLEHIYNFEYIKCIYISDRYQCIELVGILSNLKKCNCGVPRGSVLGPILFILYINAYINCKIYRNYLNLYFMSMIRI